MKEWRGGGSSIQIPSGQRVTKGRAGQGVGAGDWANRAQGRAPEPSSSSRGLLRAWLERFTSGAGREQRRAGGERGVVGGRGRGGAMQGQHGRARGGRGGYHYRSSHGMQPYGGGGWHAYGAAYGGHAHMQGYGPVYAARGGPRGGILPLGVHGAGILKRPTGPPQGPLLHGRGHQRGRGRGGGRGA